VVAGVRERLAPSKQTTNKVHMETFDVKKLNELDGKKQHRVEISNTFAALNNVRRETSNHFRKNWEYLKDKVDELAPDSKNKNIRNLYRGINDFMRGPQARSNLVKDENVDMLADSHSILNTSLSY
jgi:hypothetical protein